MAAVRKSGEPSAGGFVVLGLLLEEPHSGYELVALAERSIGHFWPITKAHIYAELPRLEQCAYVASERVAQQSVPDKLVYTATDLGRQAFGAWLATADLGPAKLHHPLLLRVFFSRALKRPALLKVLDDAEALAVATRARYLERLGPGETRAGKAGPSMRRMTLRYGVLRLDAELAWIAELRGAAASP